MSKPRPELTLEYVQAELADTLRRWARHTCRPSKSGCSVCRLQAFRVSEMRKWIKEWTHKRDDT